MLSCSIWFFAPSYWMGGGHESRCVGRVYGADGAVRHYPPGRCTVKQPFSSRVVCVEFSKKHRYVCGVQQCVWEISAGKSQGVLSKDITFSVHFIVPLPVGSCKESDVVPPTPHPHSLLTSLISCNNTVA